MPPILLPFAYVFMFLREMRDVYREPRYRGLMILVGVVLLTGTVFYSRVEGWSLVNSFYFVVITLATVGYGDLSPTKTGSKLFTVVYIFFGLSMFISFVGMLAKDREKLMRRRLGQDEDVDME